MFKLSPRLSNVCLLIAAGVLAACSDTATDTGTRLETRATIEGRIVLSDVKGLGDMTRVKIDIGRGEGGVAPGGDGSFKFSDIEADLYALTVTYTGGLTTAAKGSAYKAYTKKLTAAQGSVTNVGDVVLELGTGTVSGKATLSAGLFMADVTLRLTGGALLYETHPGKDGSYSFADVKVGTYALTTLAEGTKNTLCAVPEVIVAWDGHKAVGPDFNVNATAVTLDVADAVVKDGTSYVGKTEIAITAAAPYATKARVWTGGTAPAYTDFVPPLSLTGLIEGDNTVHVQFQDGCGTESEVFDRTVVVDTEPPTPATVSIGAGTGYVTSADGATTLNVMCWDKASGVATVSYKIGAGAWQTEGYRTTYGITLGTTEGPYEVTVKCADLLGHESTETLVTATWDKTPPLVTAVLTAGIAGVTRSQQATVDVTATDNLTGVTGIAWSEGPFDCTTTQYQAMPAGGNLPLMLTDVQGQHTVYVCARDGAGNVTAAPAATNSVTLDTVFLPVMLAKVIG